MSAKNDVTIQNTSTLISATSSPSQPPTMTVTTTTTQNASSKSSSHPSCGSRFIHTGTSCEGFSGLLAFKSDTTKLAGLVAASERHELFFTAGTCPAEVMYQPFLNDGLLNGFSFDKNIISLYDTNGNSYPMKLPVSVATTDGARLPNCKMLTNLCLIFSDQSVTVEYQFDEVRTNETKNEAQNTCTEKKSNNKGIYLAILGACVVLGVGFYLVIKYNRDRKRSDRQSDAEDGTASPAHVGADSDTAQQPNPQQRGSGARFSFDE